jgi:hypothetical protein
VWQQSRSWRADPLDGSCGRRATLRRDALSRTPLTIGNEVELPRDGAATYRRSLGNRLKELGAGLLEDWL